MAPSENQQNQIECLYPILTVSDLRATLTYFVEVLSFQEDWATETLGQVSREGFGIMLSQNAAVHPQEIWVGVERLEPFYAEFVQMRVTFEQEPQNHPWAFDMKIKIPDGHILWFGAGPKSDEPMAA